MKLVADDCSAILCEHLGCLWYHIGYVSIDEVEYNKLSKCDDKWYCEKCELHITNNLLRNEGGNLNKTIKFMLFEQK